MFQNTTKCGMKHISYKLFNAVNHNENILSAIYISNKSHMAISISLMTVYLCYNDNISAVLIHEETQCHNVKSSHKYGCTSTVLELNICHLNI